MVQTKQEGSTMLDKAGNVGPERVERVIVTPEIAQHLLQVNGNAQRPQRAAQVRFFAELLRQGRWQVTHQGMAVTGLSLQDPGSLLDGQHRAMAIIETGIAAEVYMAFGSPQEMFNAIDVGAGRSTADLLAIRGYKNARNLMGAWQLAWCWERGRVSFGATKRDDLVVGTLERYPALTAMELVKDPLLATSILTFTAFIVADETFLSDLLAGREGSPGGVVGKAIANRKQQRKTLQRRTLIAMIVKARNDAELGVVPSRPYGSRAKEAFPTPMWSPPVPYDSLQAIDNGDDDDE
jgi:hypothetical protein